MIPPIPCEEARGLLDERLDGPLGDAAEEALDAHLAACAACREVAGSLEEVDAALRGMDLPDPGPAFSDRVVAALDRAPGEPARRVLPAVPIRVRLLRGLLAAAGTGALVALAVAVLPVEALALPAGGFVPEIPVPTVGVPALLAGLPPWAAAAGALIAVAGAAIPVATLRRGTRRP